MIYLEITGRLGNQMFQYAFARFLQKTYRHEDGLTVSCKIIHREGPAEQGWDDSLQYFNVIPYVKSDRMKLSFLQLAAGTFFFAGIKRLIRILKIPVSTYLKKDIDEFCQPALNFFGIYALRGSRYVPVSDRKTRNAWCRGSFEAHRYFDFIKEDLLLELTPKQAVLEHNQELYNTILNTNSVCISIRKGDFTSPEHSNFNICTDAYYYKAVEIISQKVENFVLCVFSDDIEWVRNNMHFDFPVLYENNDGKDPVQEKLRLMYSCKHFIISNSTFSWWAQYLSRNEHKMVVSPSPWRRGEECKDLYCDDFITIPV
jgi:hypothetical protein